MQDKTKQKKGGGGSRVVFMRYYNTLVYFGLSKVIWSFGLFLLCMAGSSLN